MRDQIWYVAGLIGFMCLVRMGLAIYSYVDPVSVLASYGALPEENVQGSYLLRVWAARDIVVSVLVLLSRQSTIKLLLWACVAIEMTDLLSTQLASAAGLFNSTNILALALTVGLALVPEAIALFLIVKRTGRFV
jgi:hypothetical protein